MSTTVNGQPVAFIQVAERARAMDFYCGKLGLPLRSSDAFGDFLEVDGALLRITVLPDYKAHAHPVFGWNVPDMGAAVTALKARGVVFMIYDGMGQDDLGIWTAPDNGAQVAWFADPDGNLLMLSAA